MYHDWIHRRSTRTPSCGRRGFAGASLCLSLCASAAVGCGTGGEKVGTSDSADTVANVYDFGYTDRVASRVCSQTCVKAKVEPTLPGAGKPSIVCEQWGIDCNLPPAAASLFSNSIDASNGQIFGAYDEGPSWNYMGCGPQAAQNILNYYGVQMPIAQVAQYISTYTVMITGESWNGVIYTLPDSLASGLQTLLDQQVAVNHYVVNRISGVDPYSAVPAEIAKGNPVILLTEGGDHFQVATAFNDTSFYVIDYAGDDQWESVDQLQMTLSTTNGILSDVSLGYGGYNDDTIITVEYTNSSWLYDPPSSNVGATECTVDGYPMHCCPNGYAMVGADPSSNVFKCAPLDSPGSVAKITADTNTQRNGMHACPAGQVMVGLRADWNVLACEALPSNAIYDEWIDYTTTDGMMHTCSTAIEDHAETAVMTGIRIDQDRLSCAATSRVHN